MFPLGMATLGALIGLFVAWTSTPILSTLLPLLFGFLGGAGGLSIIKMDAAKDARKIRLLGASLFGFCGACLVALVLGIALRPFVLDLLTPPRYQLSSDADATLNDFTDALVLRRQLELAGASENEIATAFSLRRSAQAAAQTHLKEDVTELRDSAAKYVAEFDKLSQMQKDILKSGPGDNPEVIYERCKAFSAGLDALERTTSGRYGAKDVAALARPLSQTNFEQFLAPSPTGSLTLPSLSPPQLVDALGSLAAVVRSSDIVASSELVPRTEQSLGQLASGLGAVPPAQPQPPNIIQGFTLEQVK